MTDFPIDFFDMPLDQLDHCMGMGKYKMVDGKVVKCKTMREWALSFEEERHIGLDDRGDVRISTVFLGIDHGWEPFISADEEYKPVLWETMIFGGACDQEQWRYNSLEKAKEGHKKAVRLVELTNNWWYRLWAWHIRPYVEMI